MDFKFEPKGGNSPIRFFIFIDGEKVALAKRGCKRSWEKDLWQVKVFNERYRNEISEYLHNCIGIERFYNA